MKTLSSTFGLSFLICFFFGMGGVAFAVERGITHDKEGNSYQIDSSLNPWVAVDGKNWNFEISESNTLPKKIWTAKEMQHAGLIIKEKKTTGAKVAPKKGTPKIITNTVNGSMYQVDSNDNLWVSSDASNWTTYMSIIKPFDIADWKTRGLAMHNENKKVVVDFYEVIFNSRKYENRYDQGSVVQAIKEKWDPAYIAKNHQTKTRTGDMRTLDFVIEDSNGVVYQIDSKRNFWLTMDTRNWAGPVKDIQEVVDARMQQMGSR